MTALFIVCAVVLLIPIVLVSCFVYWNWIVFVFYKLSLSSNSANSMRLKKLNSPCYGSAPSNNIPPVGRVIDTALGELWASSSNLADVREVLDDNEHDTITRKVFRRLLLRHSVLTRVEEMSRNYEAHTKLQKWEHGILFKDVCGSQRASNSGGASLSCVASNSCLSNAGNCAVANAGISGNPFLLLPPSVRSYNLAVTDLFVEKALTYLAKSERWYRSAGRACCITAFVVLFVGMISAMTGLLPVEIKAAVTKGVVESFGFKVKPIDLVEVVDKKIVTEEKRTIESVNVYRGEDFPAKDWKSLIYAFTKSFTAYGMIVVLSVSLFRLGKVMMDQYEKIAERRHALRQGRLFVHLNNGKLSLHELEKAFNWNSSYDNAFSKVNFDAQAPWGRFSKDMFESMAEVAKTGINAVQKAKTGEK